LLNQAGFQVGKDRVQRIWRRAGLKVPQRQKPRRRLWLNDGSCLRLRPEHPNHAWSYDFVAAVTHDGRRLKILALLDEYSRECLALRVERQLGSNEVIETLAAVMTRHGHPRASAFGYWSRIYCKATTRLAQGGGCGTALHRTGQPVGEWLLRKFNGKLRDECLNGELFYSLREAQIVIEQWRIEYNTHRPHSALGYRPPAPQSWRLSQPSTSSGLDAI
jgi:putative transposase